MINKKIENPNNKTYLRLMNVFLNLYDKIGYMAYPFVSRYYIYIHKDKSFERKLQKFLNNQTFDESSNLSEDQIVGKIYNKLYDMPIKNTI